jgi:hypothetical protein
VTSCGFGASQLHRKAANRIPDELVRVERLELPRLAAPEPKSGVSTNFTIPAPNVENPRTEAFRSARLYITRFSARKGKMTVIRRPLQADVMDRKGTTDALWRPVFQALSGAQAALRIAVGRAMLHKHVERLDAASHIVPKRFPMCGAGKALGYLRAWVNPHPRRRSIRTSNDLSPTSSRHHTVDTCSFKAGPLDEHLRADTVRIGRRPLLSSQSAQIACIHSHSSRYLND